MADPTRLKRAAKRSWLMGCCAVWVSLVLTAQAFAAVTMTVATNDGVQGQNLTLTWSIARAVGDSTVAGAQIDIIFDTAQMQLSSCSKDPRLAQQSFSADTPTFPPVPAAHQRLRLAVFDDLQHPTATFDSGVLATCTFQVKGDAEPNQSVSLSTERVQVSDANDNLIAGVQVVVSPGRILPGPGTPTPTPTPIPCFVDRDCPLGDVCDPVQKVCKLAPTPTPTIACPDGHCPDGLTCVAGVCRDLSTPTPTPTPLPPCTTDTDCLTGFHCRANVCVPIRECDDNDPVLDRSMCRGVRETCTNGSCECGGDCNLDGYVLGNETSQMICVLSGQCDLSECAAGDFNGDGHIDGTEVCAAVTNLGLGCPAEGQPLVTGADRSTEVRSLDVGSASGLPGAGITITVNLSGGGDVATAQMDLLFDTAVLAIPDPATACRVDNRLSATDTTFTFLPQTPSTPPGMARLRLFVGDMDLCKDGLTFPVGAFDQGALLSCNFHIRPDAAPGESTLTGVRLNIGDPRGDVFGAASTTGKVTVLTPSTPTPTGTLATATPTGTLPTATPTNTVATATATGTPATATPTGTLATATPTGTRPTATATGTLATATPTGTRPTATATGTPPTATPTGTRATATATATATTKPGGGGGGGGGGCTIGMLAPGSQLFWLGVPATLLALRRRARR